MSPKLVLQVTCFILFFSNSREFLLDSINATQDRNATNEGSMVEDDTPQSFFNREETFIPKNSSIERWNHSRMLHETTTLGYNDWFFLTTQRPFLSYKDFPGRPGVATWKEINPTESKKESLKKTSPISSEVSSKAWTLETCWLPVSVACSLSLAGHTIFPIMLPFIRKIF